MPTQIIQKKKEKYAAVQVKFAQVSPLPFLLALWSIYAPYPHHILFTTFCMFFFFFFECIILKKCSAIHIMWFGDIKEKILL